jgi:aspartyl-tRNA(Asn)/glutamyl-tRNA(Gln) amidotransferase subunit C
MPISTEDVLHAADLARLALTEEEVELFTTQLKRILAHVEKLSGLDTRGVAPTSYTVPLERMLREDKVTGSIPREDALKNSPSSARDCFKVPKIIE